WALTTNLIGFDNTAVGVQALKTNSTGSNNTACGGWALYTNSSGGNNTAVGWGADVTADGFYNATAIGFNVKADASNQVRLGNDDVTALFCKGAYMGTVGGSDQRELYVDNNGKIGYLTSSARYKENIENMESVDWLYTLRPVNFNYKTDQRHITQSGLIAEEVDQVKPELVSHDQDGRPETVTYSALITPMLKAIQEQQAMIEEQRWTIQAQQQAIEALQVEVRQLKQK
ncbi:MAG TPA: tail fiber domain-containing protein, partial [Bacteroidales bacterium]|nr:tail fiber domain-containing protein [Bacteroidales bacterium]